MSILFGAELGPKADPTTTTYTPRPEWYFFFLFELLRGCQVSILAGNDDELTIALGLFLRFWAAGHHDVGRARDDLRGRRPDAIRRHPS